MSSDVQAVVRLLQVLRHGPGLADRSRRIDIPPDLCALLDCTDTVSGEELEELEEVLMAASTTLGGDDSTYIRLALNADGSELDWLRRVSSFAENELDGMSEKTVVRRVDAAFERVASALLETTADENITDVVSLANLRALFRRKRGVATLSHEITVRTYPQRDEVHEVCVVKALRDGAEYYVIGKGLPGEKTEVSSTTWEGAALLDVEQPNEHYILELLRFPRPLRKNDEHRFVVRHEVRRMAPVMTATPIYRLPSFTVRLQFVEQNPGRAWAIDGVRPYLIRTRDMPRMMDRVGRRLELDRLGYGEETFTALRPGLTYGLTWDGGI